MSLPAAGDACGASGSAATAAPHEHRGLLVYRVVLVAAQAATILLTWKVWQVREVPPLVPLAAVPQIEMAVPLIASLVVVLALPRVGLPLHTLLLGWAIVADQCRLQPQVISLTWLLWGTSGLAGGLLVARGSLAATWLYAGLHKLTSPATLDALGTWTLQGIWPGAAPGLAVPLGTAVALAEIGLGIGTLVPVCRRAVAIGAVVFHAAVLLVLAWRLDWNPEVWPWNVALACAGPLLVAPWRGPGLGDAWLPASRTARGLAVGLLVMPVGYWLGVVDAYLAHGVYAENTPRAFICSPFDRRDLGEACYRLGVVLPPARRMFVPIFRGLGRPGEWLEIEDPRWIAHLRGDDFRTLRWTEVAPPPAAAP